MKSNKKLARNLSRIDINNAIRFAYSTNQQFNSIIDYNVDTILLSLQKNLDINNDNNSFLSSTKDFYLEILDLLEEKNTLRHILHEYILVGEAFCYGELCSRSNNLMWTNFILQNPDYIIALRTILGESSYFLRPDEFLRKRILEDHKNKVQTKDLDSAVVDAVVNGENIKLNNLYLSAFKMIQNPYDLRGTSPFSTNINVESGDITGLENHKFNPDNINPINKDILDMQQKHIIADLNRWLTLKVFVPMAKLNDFYYYKDGKKQLLIPQLSRSVQ